MQQPQETIPITKLIPLLSDPDRFIRFAARVAIEHGEFEKHRAEILAITEPRPLIEGMLAIVRAAKIDEKLQAELLARETALLESTASTELKCDVLRLVALDVPARSPKGRCSRCSRASASCPFALFQVERLTVKSRDRARFWPTSTSPRPCPCSSSIRQPWPIATAQIHDAYCLRAFKTGWTAETKERLWSWYQKASDWEGGFSFQGYLDMMIQELVALARFRRRKITTSRGPSSFRFRRGCWFGGSTSTPIRVAIAALSSLYGRLQCRRADRRGRRSSAIDRSRSWEIGQGPRPTPRSATCTGRTRQTATRSPGQSRPIPSEESLPILVGRPRFARFNTTSLVLRGTGRLKTVPTRARTRSPA